MRLHVHRWGRGPRVVLVHGGVLGGRETWRAQRPLTERWTLLAPGRPGHGQSPPARQDFEPEAALVAGQLLDEPSHLVGLSYGAIVSMYAAALRPENVLSLTILEPPAAGVARGVPAVDEFGAEPPLATLREAGFPILVVSGGHSEANEIICDAVALGTGARRAVCPGRGHLVQEAPEFNALLESFLTSTA